MEKKFVIFPLLIWVCAVLVLYCAFFLPTRLVLRSDSPSLQRVEVECVWKEGRTKTEPFEFYVPLNKAQEHSIVLKRFLPDRLILKPFPESSASAIRSVEVIRFGIFRRTYGPFPEGAKTMELSCSGGGVFVSGPVVFLLFLLLGGCAAHLWFELRCRWLERLFRERRNDVLCIAFLLLYFFLTNLLMYYQNPGDDWKFQCLGAYGVSSLPEGMRMRWDTWGARVLYDGLLAVTCHASPLYFFCGAMAVFSGIALLLPALMRKGTEGETGRRIFLPALVFYLFFPFNVLVSSGWQATMVNYGLPLLLLFPLLFCIRDCLIGRRTPVPLGMLGVVCALFLCNSELVCLSVGLLSGGTLLFCLLRRERRFPVWISANLLIAAGSFAYIAVCPGNALRTVVEISRGVPAILELTLVQKALLGIFSTLFYLNHCNMLWIVLLILTAMAVWRRRNSPLLRALACLPLMTVLLSMNMPTELLGETLISRIADLRHSGTFLMLAGMQSLSLVVLLFCLVLSQKRPLEGGLAAGGVLIALATRMATGMTPVVYTSGERTFLFAYFGFLLVCLFLFDRIQETLSAENRRALFLTLALFGGILALKVLCVGLLNCIRFSF